MGAGTVAGIMVAAAVVAAAVGLAVHKLRMRHVMQSEIRAVMREYMPLVTPRAMKSYTNQIVHDLISSACSVHATVARCPCAVLLPPHEVPRSVTRLFLGQ